MKRRRRQLWPSHFSAFLWMLLLMSTDLIPVCAYALRRIQNDPFLQSWDTIPRDYDYADLEDQDVIPVAPPVPQRQPHPLQRRPPSNHHSHRHQYPSAPQPVAFGGEFHISRERMIPFVAGDVVLDQPLTANPVPVVHHKPKAIPFIPDAVPTFHPQTTSEPSYIYYTPTVYYIPTRSPTPRPNLDSIIEKKRQEFYSKNETESVVLTGQRKDQPVARQSATNLPPLHDAARIDNFNWNKPSVFSTLNKLTATENQAPVTENPYAYTSSHYFDFQRTTFRPNTVYPYPTDRARSSSEYRPSSPVIQPHLQNGLNVAAFTTERSIVTASIPASEVPFDDKEQHKRRLSSGAIAGIAIGILAPLALVAGAVVYLFYGRHFKTAAHKGVNDNYIDDSVRPSCFMNSHIELPKESSEEMTSLDNDSFLNSLEAVTIQNYWAESAKNTKV